MQPSRYWPAGLATAHVRDADGRLAPMSNLTAAKTAATFAGYIPEENLAQFPNLKATEGRRGENHA